MIREDGLGDLLEEQVLPVRGGATMSPRWPFPMGVIRSMARMDSSEGTVSSRSRSKGWIAVRLSKPEGEGDGAGMRDGDGPRGGAGPRGEAGPP